MDRGDPNGWILDEKGCIASEIGSVSKSKPIFGMRFALMKRFVKHLKSGIFLEKSAKLIKN